MNDITDKAREATRSEFSEYTKDAYFSGRHTPEGYYVQQFANAAVEAATSELRAENSNLRANLAHADEKIVELQEFIQMNYPSPHALKHRDKHINTLRAENAELRAELERMRGVMLERANGAVILTKERDTIRAQLDAMTKEIGETKEQERFTRYNLEAERDQLREQLAQVTRELANRQEALDAKKKLIPKCDHLPELVINSEDGYICCECWALEATAERDAAQALLAKFLNWLDCKLAVDIAAMRKEAQPLAKKEEAL